MNCRYGQRKLVAFLDGELPDILRKEVAIHLENCPKCQQQVKIFLFHQNLLKEIKPLNLSATWREKFFQKLSEEKRRDLVPPVPLVRFLPYPLTAAGLAIAFLILVVFSPVIYGVSRPQLSRDVSGLVQNTFFCFSGKTIFSPTVLFDFCDEYCRILCQHCENCQNNSCGR